MFSRSISFLFSPSSELHLLVALIAAIVWIGLARIGGNSK